MNPENVDLIVIGSGQGGTPLAVDFAKSGKRVVLFESGRYGGTCSNYGCTPSKTFLASAHAAGRARNAAKIGVHCEISIDAPAVLARVNKLRDEWQHDVREKLEKAGVRIVHAAARFTGTRTVEGGGVTVTAPNIAIDTGGQPACPPVEGLAGTPYLTTHNFFDMQTVPESIIVFGGGYVGLELGQGCARLGSRVAIVEPGPRILSHEEPGATAVLHQALEDDGIAIHINSAAERVEYDGAFRVVLDTGEELRAAALLVATGRRPNTDALEADETGVELDDRGYVRVDEHLRTACPGIFALGDVAHQPQFTHVSWEDYRRIKDVINGGSRTRDDRPLAYCVFTEPQLAHVGFTEAQAREKGYDPMVVQLDLRDVARGIEWNLERGFFRIVADRKTEKMIGATFVGYEAGELIHVIYAHIMNGATWHVLDESVHVHPTFAEGLPTTVRQFAK